MTDEELEPRVHHAVLRHVVDRGYAPDVGTLAETVGVSTDDALRALADLEVGHGLVLHPGGDSIWLAHPFSLSPTAFWVRDERDEGDEGTASGWWAPCAWCALGVAELVGGMATIETRSGGEDAPLSLRVRGETVDPAELVVHFPVPVARAWDNVHHFCASTLAFESEGAVDDWCARHGYPRGAVVPVAQAAHLAREWYGGHLDEDWHKWSPEEAAAIFASVGLEGPHWAVEVGRARF